jgi:PAS domain S-box-containing protein
MKRQGQRRHRITAREGEQKLRAVAEALPDLLFVLDEKGTYIEALSSSEALLYARADQLVGRRMHDVLPRASADLFLNTVRRTLKTGKSQILEYALDVPAGPRYFEGRTSPLRGAGRPRRVVWISRDITERRHLEERLREQVTKTSRAYRELKKAQDQLVRSEKFASVGMLISNVAHELNNPLNVMYGNLKLLREEGRNASDPRLRRMLEDAMRAAERARTVMVEFRNFMRDVRSAEFADLNDCLQEALTLARADVQPQIRVIDRRGPIPKIRCIPHQIREVFRNLIANALESIEGDGAITIRSRLGGGRVVVDIQDTGRGIPKEQWSRLFDPFWTTKPVGKGLGLGLAIGAMIIDRHNGSLSYVRRSGPGSTFRVTLPVDGGARKAAT